MSTMTTGKAGPLSCLGTGKELEEMARELKRLGWDVTEAGLACWCCSLVDGFCFLFFSTCNYF